MNTETSASIEPKEFSVRPFDTPFHPVSLTKLSVLWVCTLGLYSLPWFYRNWQLIKYRESLDISPPARALFSIFYCYSCFAHMRRYGVQLGFNDRLAAGPLATAWIVMMLIPTKGVVSLLYFGSFIFFLPVQAYANKVNKHVVPSHNQNSRFTAWNWVAVVFGGLLVIAAVVGTLVERS